MADGTVPAGSSRLERAIAWTLRNLDGVFAIAVALVVGLLDILSDDLSDNIVSGATLLVLAGLVFGLLTERKRRVSDIRLATSETRRAIEDLAIVRTLSGERLERALAEARQHTDRWIFKGGTGTYLRAVTLPVCVREAQRQRRSLTVKIEIVNPADEAACTAYARFRQTFAHRHAPAPLGPWTPERTRKESYATVLAASWYRQRLDTLDIDVCLSAVASTLRFDLSASCLIITQDDPFRENMLIDSDQLLYDYYATELHQSREQATPVPLRGTTPLSDEPTVDEVRRLFDGLGLPLPVTFSDADVNDVTDRALHAENPYRR